MVNISIMRQKRRMSQRDLSVASGVPQQTISSIESGARKNPGVETLAALAKVLRCTVDDFIFPDSEVT